MFCLSMQHRNERRGLGGIFFDDLNDYDQEMLLNFATGETLLYNDRMN
jgi:coproporphyrinogen III oxidase